MGPDPEPGATLAVALAPGALRVLKG
jgi:hypothetical protein